MSTYILGDIQGCHDELLCLLERIHFNDKNDRLLFAGDLVNRGPKSLETLRFVKNLGAAADSVLGNHDLHLLALAKGNESHASGGSLDTILNAPDRNELLEWLINRPLMIHLPEQNGAVIHAGLPPQWTLQQAQSYAGELESVLRSEDNGSYFADMYGNKPKLWKADLEGMKRLRFITNCFTRLRFCTLEGKLSLKDKGPPGSQKTGTIPWFDAPERQTLENLLFFGHWSTLGLLNRNNVWSLDTGCLWGGQLTAIRLEDLQIFQQPCSAAQDPAAFA